MPINRDSDKHDAIVKESENKQNKRPKDKKTEMMFNEVDPLYTFDDIVLDENIKNQILYIVSMEINRDLIYGTWGLKKVFHTMKNISINLYGSSGTGKTMTAHAIAAYLGRKLIIVNYADIESKYVGETSKNLVSLFKKSTQTNAILFFDEADALLSKRVTSMNNATDVSVNQTRSVLLQLLDSHTGIVLFTTNFIQNYDSAFYRRITSHIEFKLPNQEMRTRIWEHYLVAELPIEIERDSVIKELSKIESVSGSDISSSVLKAAIKTAYLKEDTIKIESIKGFLNEAIATKRFQSDSNYEVTTKKVSENYVREKKEKGGLIDGLVSKS